MSAELSYLYEEIEQKYEVKLLTTSCFGKKIDWMHTVERIEFSPLLHGDELIFNSGINYTSEKWLKEFIDALIKVRAGGLIISTRNDKKISEEMIEYCNKLHFPLFSAAWKTPYVDITRKFSEILLKNEQRETNLIAAFKSAIYYPSQEELYLDHFERSGFFRDMSYTVVILSCHTYDTKTGNERLEQIKKKLRYVLRKGIVYEENGRLIVLVTGYLISGLQRDFGKICDRDPNIYVGIGTIAKQIQDIHNSYENAYTAYRLTKTTISKNMLCYGELGIYKLLADTKDPAIYPAFVEETLGPLIAHDRENDTQYLKTLRCFFENDCSIIRTSKALYCHKNTLNYKMNAIKGILGYDIMSNENRTKIMIAFYIRNLGEDYY